MANTTKHPAVAALERAADAHLDARETAVAAFGDWMDTLESDPTYSEKYLARAEMGFNVAVPIEVVRALRAVVRADVEHTRASRAFLAAHQEG